MATKVHLIRVTHENENVFKVEQNIDSAGYVTILQLEENGCLHAMWPGVRITCSKYWEKLIDDIGTEMIA